MLAYGIAIGRSPSPLGFVGWSLVLVVIAFRKAIGRSPSPLVLASVNTSDVAWIGFGLW